MPLPSPKLTSTTLSLFVSSAMILLLASCGRKDEAATPAPPSQETIVGVVKVSRHPLQRRLTVSAELVPFQETDIYAKEAGYVAKLLVDYGTHVKKGQLMAVLEIPELQAQIRQDQAALESMNDRIANARNQLSRTEAQHKVLHLSYQRFKQVSETRPGLIAQQEVDDVEGKDLASEAQVEAAKATLSAAQSNLAASQSKLEHDQAIFAYSRITAPFDGVVTQRYANLGMLMQAGINSSTQAMPLVKLSEEDRFRLVIPVPESYVGYVKIGDPVSVQVPALNKSFPGNVARFAPDVHDATRTMHTEVDVPNPKGVLIPGVYAEATLTLNQNANALTIPTSAVQREDRRASVYVVDANNVVQVRPVQLGIEGEGDIGVLSGLSEGDEVVAGDRSSLKPGQHVHPQIVTPPAYGSAS